MEGMRDSVTVSIEASAERIWTLLSDVTRIGEFSPETLAAEWLDGATGPAVGAKFRGHVKRNGRGPMYWTECRVTDSEPGRTFAFTVFAGGRPVNNWGYRLEQAGSDREDTVLTDVTEWFELADTPMVRIYWRLFGTFRSKTNRRGMQTTLEQIKLVVEDS
jgi:uncharacterized protein YndB with AHSA1/START domain